MMRLHHNPNTQSLQTNSLHRRNSLTGSHCMNRQLYHHPNSYSHDQFLPPHAHRQAPQFSQYPQCAAYPNQSDDQVSNSKVI